MTRLTCIYCGRIGTRGFVCSSGNWFAGDATWCCASRDACRQRQDRAEPAVFVRGNDRLNELLADPDIAAGVAEIEAEDAGRQRKRCTASGEVRSWDEEAWVNSEGHCPDCGAIVSVWVRGTDLSPYAKARAHMAPLGVEPTPYGVDGKPGKVVASGRPPA